MTSDTTTCRKIVALLPMKANSVRVKGKNFRDFCGKPLFRWILDTLLSVDEIDSVVINTDARHILAENGLVDTDRTPDLDSLMTLANNPCGSSSGPGSATVVRSMTGAKSSAAGAQAMLPVRMPRRG